MLKSSFRKCARIWLASASVGFATNEANIYLLLHMWIMLGMEYIICTPSKPFLQKSNSTFYEGSRLCGIHLVQRTQTTFMEAMDTVRVASKEFHWMSMLHSAGLSAFIPTVVWSGTKQPIRLMLLTGINCVRSWPSVLIHWIIMVTCPV